jgi:hypothetical protein
MNITVDDKPAFTPINVVLESYEEAQKFYAMMNFSPLVDGLNITVLSDKMRQQLTNVHRTISEDSNDGFQKMVKYMKQWCNKYTSPADLR